MEHLYDGAVAQVVARHTYDEDDCPTLPLGLPQGQAGLGVVVRFNQASRGTEHGGGGT